MTQEKIIEQIEQSFNNYTGSNEAILDASHYIAAEFDVLKNFINKISNSILVPSKQEWWDLVYEARKISENG